MYHRHRIDHDYMRDSDPYFTPMQPWERAMSIGLGVVGTVVYVFALLSML